MSVTSQIFLYVVCVCAGIAIGALIRSRVKKPAPPAEQPTPGILSTQPAEAGEEQAPKADPRRDPPPPAEAQAPSLALPGEAEMLTAWRKRDGSLWLEMDGQRLESKEALGPEQRRRLLNAVLDLRPWLAAETPPAPRSEPPARPSKEAKQAPAEETRPVGTARTILEQIDDVLQAKLETSPFRERKIQLVAGPGGTVIVKDGIQQYEGIDAVPDAQIQELIRQAVREWEKGSK